MIAVDVESHVAAIAERMRKVFEEIGAGFAKLNQDMRRLQEMGGPQLQLEIRIPDAVPGAGCVSTPEIKPTSPTPAPTAAALQTKDIVRALAQARRQIQKDAQANVVLSLAADVANLHTLPDIRGVLESSKAPLARTLAMLDNTIAALDVTESTDGGYTFKPRAWPDRPSDRAEAVSLDRELRDQGFDRIGRIDAVGRRSLWLKLEPVRHDGTGQAIVLRGGREGLDTEVRIPGDAPYYRELESVLLDARLAAEYEDPRGFALDLMRSEEQVEADRKRDEERARVAHAAALERAGAAGVSPAPAAAAQPYDKRPCRACHDVRLLDGQRCMACGRVGPA